VEGSRVDSAEVESEEGTEFWEVVPFGCVVGEEGREGWRASEEEGDEVGEG